MEILRIIVRLEVEMICKPAERGSVRGYSVVSVFKKQVLRLRLPHGQDAVRGAPSRFAQDDTSEELLRGMTTRRIFSYLRLD